MSSDINGEEILDNAEIEEIKNSIEIGTTIILIIVIIIGIIIYIRLKKNNKSKKDKY